MNKEKTIFVSTLRKQEKDSAFALLRTQVERGLVEPSATPSSASSGASVPTSTSAISNTLSEAPTFYTTDGVVLFDDFGVRWGEIINGVPVGDASYLTAIQINAVLSRLDASTFELPSRAQYVTDVWFDNLKAEPTNHYAFVPDSTILTVSALGSDVIVTASYLNEDAI